MKKIFIYVTFLIVGCGSLTGEYTGADQVNVVDADSTPELEVEIHSKIEPEDKNTITEKPKAEVEVEKPSVETKIPKLFSLGGVTAKPLNGGGYILDGVANNSGDAGHAFEVKLQLKNNKKTTFTFFGSKRLGGGIDISFQKVDESVQMTIVHNKLSHTHTLKGVHPHSVDVVIDIHNDHADTHILLWKKGKDFFDNEGCTFDGGCLYNTEDFAFDVWVGVGKASGVYWGIKESEEGSIIQIKGPLDANSNA